MLAMHTIHTVATVELHIICVAQNDYALFFTPSQPECGCILTVDSLLCSYLGITVAFTDAGILHHNVFQTAWVQLLWLDWLSMTLVCATHGCNAS